MSQCEKCGGDGQTHINVAASVAKSLGLSIVTVMDWECQTANAVSRALNALTWAEMCVDIEHCCCCADHCRVSGSGNRPSGTHTLSTGRGGRDQTDGRSSTLCQIKGPSCLGMTEIVPESMVNDVIRAAIRRPAMIIVGDWIRRDKRGAPHLVESIVAGDVITRCGRRLRDEPNGDGGLVIALYGQKCRVCAPHVETFSTSSSSGSTYTYSETNGYGSPNDEQP